MNTYSKSNGERVPQKEVDRLTREAKRQKLQSQKDEHGYNFCEECGINEIHAILDCSHDISVKKAKESGRSELCWDVNNITILCREHHQIKDGLNFQK